MTLTDRELAAIVMFFESSTHKRYVNTHKFLIYFQKISIMKRFEMLSKHAKLKRSTSPSSSSPSPSPSPSSKPTSPQTNDLNYKRRSLSPVEHYTAAASSPSASVSVSMQDNIEEKLAQLTDADEHAAWDKFRDHAFSYGENTFCFPFFDYNNLLLVLLWIYIFKTPKIRVVGPFSWICFKYLICRPRSFDQRVVELSESN